jgi:N-acetylmuramoyl-L-alanine amidase|nr:MAG TPA: Cell wall hydrolase autolysin [Caudoviricetes sp.]
MKIYIDAGHNYNKWNTGATGNGLREQDVTYYIAAALCDILTDAGVKVKMSREQVTDILGMNNSTSLSARYRDANTWGADYFVSIHCNSGGGTGTETLVYSTGGVAEHMAQTVQQAIVKKLDMRDRGVKVRNELTVLKNTHMPAILIETGFIDNALDADKLRNRQQDFAQAIADGVLNFLGIEIKKGEDDMAKVAELEKRIAKLENKMVYNYVDDNMPNWAKATIQKLMDRDILRGDTEGKLGLTDEMLRILVVLDRAGVFKEV